MAKRILAVHLSGSQAQLACAEASLRSLRVTRLEQLERQTARETLARAASAADIVVASLPGDAALFRILSFPFHDRRRLAQAVGPAIEEHVPLSLEESFVAFDNLSKSAGGRVLAALAPAERFEAQQLELSESGLKPSGLLWAPSAILLSYQKSLEGSPASVVVIHAENGGTLVASLRNGSVEGLRLHHDASDEILVRNVVWSLRTLDGEGATVVLGGNRAAALRPRLEQALDGRKIASANAAAPLTVDSAPSDWSCYAAVLGMVLIAAGETAVPTLLFRPAATAAGAYAAGAAQVSSAPLLRWAAITAVLLLLSGALDTARIVRRTRALESRADDIVQRVLPSAAGKPGRRLKLETKLAELEQRQGSGDSGPGVSALKTLIALSESVPRQLSVEFDNYIYDPPNVRMRGHAEDFEDVTRLESALASDARIASAEASGVRSAVDGSGVDFDLTVRLTTNGDAS